MSRLPGFCLGAATVVLGVVGGVCLTTAGAVTSSPHITAHPDEVMVNTATHLIGKNFAPSTSYTVKECGSRNWIAPRDPCDSTNSIVVSTNAHGQFESSFTVLTCSSGSDSSPGFAERCYIGVPAPSGIDTVTLLGAARITVTGP
jgi:hypothetical protein